MSLVKPLFVASITSLTLMMINTSSNINLHQQMGNLQQLVPSSRRGCSNCKKKQSLLQNSVLSNSNTTLHDVVLLMYEFCNSHHTYNTVAKETFLPQEGCKETHLSRNTINKWFSYFQLLCMRAQKKVLNKIPVRMLVH